jgi:hypothetical protein
MEAPADEQKVDEALAAELTRTREQISGSQSSVNYIASYCAQFRVVSETARQALNILSRSSELIDSLQSKLDVAPR